MHDAGQWLVPRFCDETRMQKSPGPYWTVMLLSRVLNRPIDESVARWPNVGAALVVVLSVFWLARRIAGDRAAIFAGFATASSALILWWSHRGASDLGLTACTTLSLTAFYVAFTHAAPVWQRRGLLLLGYFAAGAGMLYKMPMPVACVGAPMFLYVLIHKRWRDLWHPIHLVGLAVFLLPWLPWALAVRYAEPAAMEKWYVEFVDRFTGNLPNVAEQQRDPKMYFLYLLAPLVYALPFSLSLPAAVWRGVQRDARIRRDGQIFLLGWFLSLLAIFTVAAGKEMRYFMPALPPLFVLLGIELAQLFDPRQERGGALVRWVTRGVYVLLPLGAVAAGVALATVWFGYIGGPQGYQLVPDVLVPYSITAAIFTIGTCAAAWAYAAGRRNVSFGLLVAAMWGMWLWFWPRMAPVIASQRPFVELAGEMRNRFGPEPELRHELRFIGSQDARLIWYSDIRIPRLLDQLVLLREQQGRRSLEREKEQYARKMLDGLRGPQRVLYVATLADYGAFLKLVGQHEADAGRSLPPTYIWLASPRATLDRTYVIVSNRPRPAGWPEPVIAELATLKPEMQMLLRAALQATPTAPHAAGNTAPPATSRAALPIPSGTTRPGTPTSHAP